MVDIVIEEMLISLRSSLQVDLMSYMHTFDKEPRNVYTKVDHIEKKIVEFATTINDLVDASEGKDEEMEWIRDKIADMEDRNRRNNLKVRRIPESIAQVDLCSYVTTMFKASLRKESDLNVTVDRIHHLQKPPHLPNNLSQHTLLKRRHLNTITKALRNHNTCN